MKVIIKLEVLEVIITGIMKVIIKRGIERTTGLTRWC